MGKVKVAGKQKVKATSSIAEPVAAASKDQRRRKAKRAAEHRESSDVAAQEAHAVTSNAEGLPQATELAEAAAEKHAQEDHVDADQADVAATDELTMGDLATAVHGDTAMEQPLANEGPGDGVPDEDAEAAAAAAAAAAKADKARAARLDRLFAGAGTETVVMLLRQALKGEDAQLLERCLNVSSDRVIRGTVRQLKGREVTQLLHALAGKLQSLRPGARNALKWLKYTVTTHAGFVAASPGLQDSLCTMYEVIEARLQTFPALLALSGRLDLLMSQVPEGTATEAEQLLKQPMTYHEETDDEAEPAPDDPFAPQSDTDESDYESQDDIDVDGGTDGPAPVGAVASSDDDADDVGVAGIEEDDEEEEDSEEGSSESEDNDDDAEDMEE